MAINWTKPRLEAVKSILHTYDAKSRQCDTAANLIWPHAKEQDEKNACRWQIWPKRGCGWGLAPKVSIGGRSWDWHVVVETERHCVDALTGAAGTEAGHNAGTYIEAKFNHPECHEVSPWDGSPIITKGRR